MEPFKNPVKYSSSQLLKFRTVFPFKRIKYRCKNRSFSRNYNFCRNGIYFVCKSSNVSQPLLYYGTGRLCRPSTKWRLFCNLFNILLNGKTVLNCFVYSVVTLFLPPYNIDTLICCMFSCSISYRFFSTASFFQSVCPFFPCFSAVQYPLPFLSEYKIKCYIFAGLVFFILI